MNEASLSQFHPLVADWFTDTIGEPTDVQTQAWPKIAAGEHVLITAPTGSGKTLTAFLWALNQLVRRELPIGHTSVLYVSPLKALNNDIRRNLLQPLRGLRQVFQDAGHSFPNIRVLTRSGDTPHSDRRHMQRHPPEILITTPESLNLLLSSGGGRSILTKISTVILDEIHAVVGTKRGDASDYRRGPPRAALWRIPANRAVRHDPTHGDRCRVRRRIHSRWRPAQSEIYAQIRIADFLPSR